MALGSWALAEELFARGDAAFAGELRRVHDADRLGAFAPKWYADARPFARQALLDFLANPLKAYRHEPFVKRLFKLAEAAGDDEVMSRFLVAFDRSVRRHRTTVHRYLSEQFATRAAAEAAAVAWTAKGYTSYGVSAWSQRFSVSAGKTEPAVWTPSGTTMPRLKWEMPEGTVAWYERKCVLFSLATRRYLRRRTWRYFRLLGKRDAERYAISMLATLPQYTDADADSDLHLLDNWGLTHALFGASDVLAAEPRGWVFAADRSFADLVPAPRFAEVWTAERLFATLLAAQSRPVRQWSRRLLETNHTDWLAKRPARDLLALADNADPDLSAFGFARLEHVNDLADIPIGEWLTRLDGDDLDRLQRLSDLLVRRLDRSRVSPPDALRMAMHRSRPVAALGLSLLQRQPPPADASTVLPLLNAESATVRPALVAWLGATLSQLDQMRPEWIVEALDSKHADVRTAGWQWLAASPDADAPAVWHKLLESPYDDVRERLLDKLESHTKSAHPDAVCLLWATVLLNVARGGRYKPGVVAQIVDRLSAHPAEADALLPLLAVAVRSGRVTEFRAGLLGLVRLADTHPDLLPDVRRQFPEIEW